MSPRCMRLASSAQLTRRVKKLQEAIEALKLILEGIPPNATPKTRVPGVGQHPNPSAANELAAPKRTPTIKNEGGDDPMAAAITKLAGVVESLGGRVEGIEKARNKSNSVEDQGETDTKSAVQKSGVSWKGIL